MSVKSPNQIQPQRADRKRGHFTSEVLMWSATCVYLQRGKREASKPDLWELHAAVSASLSRVTEWHHTVLSDHRSHCSETWTSRCCTLTLLRLLAERLDGKRNLLNAAFVSGNVEELQLDSYKSWTGLKMVNMLMEIFTQLYIRSICAELQHLHINCSANVNIDIVLIHTSIYNSEKYNLPAIHLFFKIICL